MSVGPGMEETTGNHSPRPTVGEMYRFLCWHHNTAPVPAHGTDTSTRIVVIKIRSRAGQGQLTPMMASEEWTATSLGMERGVVGL